MIGRYEEKDFLFPLPEFELRSYERSDNPLITALRPLSDWEHYDILTEIILNVFRVWFKIFIVFFIAFVTFPMEKIWKRV